METNQPDPKTLGLEGRLAKREQTQEFLDTGKISNLVPNQVEPMCPSEMDKEQRATFMRTLVVGGLELLIKHQSARITEEKAAENPQ